MTELMGNLVFCNPQKQVKNGWHLSQTTVHFGPLVLRFGFTLDCPFSFGFRNFLRLIHLFWFSIFAALAGVVNQIQFIPWHSLLVPNLGRWVGFGGGVTCSYKVGFPWLVHLFNHCASRFARVDHFVHSATIHALKLGLSIGCVFAFVVYLAGLFESRCSTRYPAFRYH